MYPVSSDWRLFYWDFTTISDIFDHAEWTGYADPNTMTFHSEAGVYTAIVLRPNIGYTYTVEIDLVFNQLPDSFDDPDASRLGLLIYTDEDNSSGLLFSDQGIAWANFEDGDLKLIDGSQGIITPGTPYRIRLVADAREGVIRVFITSYLELPHGQKFRFSTTIFGQAQMDQVRLEMIGAGAEVQLVEWKADYEPKAPSLPPEAQVVAPKVARFGEYVLLDGSASTSPSGDLTYLWQLISAPMGSRYVRNGVGYTQDVSGLPSVEFDLYTHDVFPDDTAPGDIVLYRQSSSVIDPSSFDARGLIDDQHFKASRPIFPKNTDVVPWTILHQAVIDDPQAKITFATPDVPGLWVFRLTVVDPATGYSSSEDVVVEVETSMLLSGRPFDLSFIWRMIGSQWGLVEDREKIQAVWEALGFGLSGLLLYLWEVNSSKSLATIPRYFARKWWRISTFLDAALLGEVTHQTVSLPRFSVEFPSGTVPVNNGHLTVIVDGQQTTIQFDSPTVTLQQFADLVNGAWPNLCTVRGTRLMFQSKDVHFVIRHESVGQVLGFSEDAYSYWQFDAETLDNPDPDEAKRRILVASGPDGFVDSLGELKGLWVAVDFDLYQVIDVDGDHLLLDRPLPSAGTYTVTVADTVDQLVMDFDRLEIVDDDVLGFLRGDSQVLEEWPIVGKRTSKLMILPTARALNGDYRRLHGLYKRDHIELYTDVVSVPSIQDEVESPDTVYHEGVDYRVTVDDQGRSWLDFIDGRAETAEGWWAEFVYIKADQTIYDNFGSLVDLEPQDVQPNDYLSAVTGMFYLSFKVPAIRWIEVGVNILAGLPVVERQGKIIFIDREWTADYGRILVAHGTSVRTYLYPRSVGIATNPRTGRAYDVGDEVDEWDVLANGVMITDGHGWGSIFGLSWIQEVHSYLVEVDANLISPRIVGKLLAYLKRVTPIWVKPYLAALRSLEDSIDLQSDINWDIDFDPIDYIGEPLPDAWVPRVGWGNRYNYVERADNGKWADRIQYDHGFSEWILRSRRVDEEQIRSKCLWFWWPTIGRPAEEPISLLCPCEDDTSVDFYQTDYWSVESSVTWGGANWTRVDNPVKYGLYSYQLNGSGSYIWVDRLENNYNSIYEVWLRRDNPLASGDYQPILVAYDAAMNLSWAVLAYNDPGSGNVIQLWLVDERGGTHVTSWVHDIADGQWHSWAVFVGDHGVELYYDGASQGVYGSHIRVRDFDIVHFGGDPTESSDCWVDQLVVEGARGYPGMFRQPQPWRSPCVVTSTTDLLPNLVTKIEDVYGDHFWAWVETSTIGDHLVVKPKVRRILCGGSLAAVLDYPQDSPDDTPHAQPVWWVDQDEYNLPLEVQVTLSENYTGTPPQADSIFFADSGVYADQGPLTGVQSTTRMLAD